MSFTFGGNKFSYRKYSDDINDNSTHISTSSSNHITVTKSSNDTYHFDIPNNANEEDDDLDDWDRYEWLDYCRRILYRVKQTIIEHEKKGDKLENISFDDPNCEVLSITFITTDDKFDKTVITMDEILSD